jgi:hypothetical protein
VEPVAEPRQVQDERFLLQSVGRLAPRREATWIGTLAEIALAAVGHEGADRARPSPVLAAIVETDAAARAGNLPADVMPELEPPDVLPAADKARQDGPVTLPSGAQ